MFNKGLGFIYVLIATRALESTGFGIINGAIATVSLITFFSDIGLSTLVIREVARDKSNLSRYMNNVFGAKIPLNILTFIIIVIVANVFSKSPETIYAIYLIGLSTIITSFYGVFNSVFMAHERMEFQQLGQVLNSAILLGGAVIASYYHMSIIIWASVYLLASVAVLLFEYAVCAWKFAVPRIQLDLGFIIPAIRESLPFALTGQFVTIYYQTSSVLLFYMVGDSAVSWYNLAFRMIQFLGLIPNILFGAVFPVSSRLFATSKDTLRFLFERSLKYLLIFAIPLGVGTTLLASRFTPLVGGQNTGFGPASAALQILVWSEVMIFINMAFSNQLNSINKQTVVTKQTALCAIVNVVLNLIAIPLFGYLGACVVTVLTEAVSTLFLYRALMNSEFKIPSHVLRDLSKITIAGLVMGAFLYAIKDQGVFQGIPGLAVMVVLSVCVYFVLIFLLRVVDRDDMNMLRKLIAIWKREPQEA
jgi:O-antigen/teichoic acid export membrane protein